MTKNVIIIGAGIAGPALAISLKRLGFDPVVFEAREEGEMGEGVFLGLTPNGLNALKNFLDIRQLREEYTPGKMEFYNSKGRPIGELDTKDQLREYGAETIQIKRAKISELLRAEASRQGIEIKYGHRLTNLEERSGSVEVLFQNGRLHSADLLIACDGVHSACRNALFPNAPKPVYTRQLSTGAMVSMNGTTPEFGAISMVFGKRAFFAYAASNRDEVWWFNNFYREREPSPEEVQTTLQREIKTYLLEIHRDDPEPVPDIIRQTDRMFAYPIYEMPALEKWHSDRVCLIGDAAHATAPHIGQGASLALEDVIVLSGCLGAGDDYRKAFSDFQELRRPRVEKIVKQARKVGNAKSKPNPVATFFRDLLLRHFIRFEKKKMDWVYRYEPAQF